MFLATGPAEPRGGASGLLDGEAPRVAEPRTGPPPGTGRRRQGGALSVDARCTIRTQIEQSLHPGLETDVRIKEQGRRIDARRRAACRRGADKARRCLSCHVRCFAGAVGNGFGRLAGGGDGGGGARYACRAYFFFFFFAACADEIGRAFAGTRRPCASFRAALSTARAHRAPSSLSPP